MESIKAMSLDLTLFGISILLLVGYHLYVRIRVRHNPGFTIQAVNNRARSAWVENIMTTPGKDILAVQTLRNSTMAATFLASTAILLIFGVLNLSEKGDALSSVLETISSEPLTGSRLWALKLLPLLVDFFWAFFCFSLAVRTYNHVGYLINASNRTKFCLAPSYVARLLNRSGHYYSMGMRSYYLSVPLVFWMFGPYYMLAASIGIVVALHHIDKVPESDPFLADEPTGDDDSSAAGQPGELRLINKR